MTEAGVRSFARLACMQGVTTATDLVNKLGADDCAVLEAVTGDDACAVRILPAFQAFHGTHGAAQGAEHVRGIDGAQHRPAPLRPRQDDARRLDPGLFGAAALAGPFQRRAERHLGHGAERSTRPISRPTTAPA